MYYWNAYAYEGIYEDEMVYSNSEFTDSNDEYFSDHQNSPRATLNSERSYTNQSYRRRTSNRRSTDVRSDYIYTDYETGVECETEDVDCNRRRSMGVRSDYIYTDYETGTDHETEDGDSDRSSITSLSIDDITERIGSMGI